MIQLIIWMLVRHNAFVWGGDYRIPMMHGLLNEDFIEELKEDGTYNEMDFASEYESLWAGAAQNAFFNPDEFDKFRTLHKAEDTYMYVNDAEFFYIMGIDVARLKAQTAIQILKVVKRPIGYYKYLVNTYIFENRHFLSQSVEIKKKAMEFNVQQIIIDGSGLGVGLVDFLILDNQDEVTGNIYPSFAVNNDANYDQFKKPDSLPLLHIIKPNDELNSQIFVNCLTQFSSGRIKLLVHEKTAKTHLLNTKKGREMESEQKAYYLMPYNYTSILKQEMMNLRQKHDGKNLRLEQVRPIGKDKFSAFVYALWYVKLLEDKLIQVRKARKATDFVFYN